MQRYRTLLEAIYRLYEHSGFAMAGAVAFSFVVSLFPFCIFLGAVSGLFGGRDLAAQAVNQLFEILPQGVAAGLAPQVEAIMGRTRIDLLTVSAGLSLFFATNAIETLRTALNGAYRVVEKRPYLYCLARSMMFVFVSAVSMLVLTWVVVVGPALATRLDPSLTNTFTLMRSTWMGAALRYASAAAVIGGQLLAFHLWLAAGKRRIKDVWPGVLVSTVLWLTVASLYSYYLNFSDYTRFYAGLSQLMVAMIFFQMTAVIVILGAELNRGIYEFKRMSGMGLDAVAPMSSRNR
ncbi:membrane protein [Hyphomicrobium sp. 1Nfss2.1]|uniref:YihY/virulence factor BrkB family protein n=1 Tax=Hyphomicrobium sp. 1Nfss2.1 TaxID=3413936 RepID=UPI003C7D8996